MLIGELEPGPLEYDNIAFQILLMIFVFLMIIVMMNLMNALAISDIGKILADGKIIGIQQEIYNMHKMERIHLFCVKHGVFLKNARDVSLFKKDFKKSKVVSYPDDFWPIASERLCRKLPLGETLYYKWVGAKFLINESKRLELSSKRRKKNEMDSIEELMEKLENMQRKQEEDREENREKLAKILELLTESQHSK